MPFFHLVFTSSICSEDEYSIFQDIKSVQLLLDWHLRIVPSVARWKAPNVILLLKDYYNAKTKKFSLNDFFSLNTIRLRKKTTYTNTKTIKSTRKSSWHWYYSWEKQCILEFNQDMSSKTIKTGIGLSWSLYYKSALRLSEVRIWRPNQFCILKLACLGHYTITMYCHVWISKSYKWANVLSCWNIL